MRSSDVTRKPQALFDKLPRIANDVGLLPEEYDASHSRFLGNFPQAFSHVALINSARNLSGHGGPSEDRAARHRDEASRK